MGREKVASPGQGLVFIVIHDSQRAEVEFGFATLHLRDLCGIRLETYSRQLTNLEHRRDMLAGGENVGSIRIWRWYLKLWE